MFSTFSLLFPLFLATSALPPLPVIDMAFAERRGARAAVLVLRAADPRLMAQCFDPVGFAPEEVDRARRAVLGQKVWLYQGPRRIARGHIESLGVRADPALACAVVAKASFERPLPLIGRGDVLWATTQVLDTSPREPVGQDVIERARQALPADLAEACLERQAITRRGTRAGTYVGFVCLQEGTPHSAIAFVPKQGTPRVSLVERGDYGTLWLIDVLNPRQGERHRLVMARDWPVLGQRRFELWEDDGIAAFPAASEALFGDMMFLLAEEARTRGPDALSTDDSAGEGVAGPLPGEEAMPRLPNPAAN